MKTDYVTQKFVCPGLLCLLFVAQLLLPAQAAVVDLAKAPLYTTTTSAVKPNLMFILDNSGSMNDDFLPDEAAGSTTYGYKSSQCNGVAYNPATTYSLPVDSSGNNKTAPSFTSAWIDGYKTSSGSTNLTNTYYYKYAGSQPPLSYTYNTNGVIATTFYNECQTTATASPTATIAVSGNASTSVSSIRVNGVEILSGATSSSTSSSTVASRVASAISLAGYSATVSGSTVTITGPASAAAITPVVTSTNGGMSFATTAFTPFVKVSVSSTSGPGGTDERQNYANWYSFYRTRLSMMKTSVGQAFKNITSNFRVGFSTISYTGTDDSNAGFLHIDDFVSGTGLQKDTFYTKLYGASGSSFTPLRGALAKAGKIYAGKLGADPMQYSCQQNFALLSTDGYWNTSTESTTYGPFGLDGNPVGQRDGSNVAPPMNDGATSTVTKTTPTVTTTVVTTPKTVVDRSTRTVTATATSTQQRTDTYTRTVITWARGSNPTRCPSGQKQSTTSIYTGTTSETKTSGTTSAQTQEQLTTTGSNDISTTTSTVTHTVVTTNGVVTNDTTSNPVVNTTPSSVVTSGPTTSTWTNVGAPATGTFGPTSSYSPAIASITWSAPTVSTNYPASCTSNPPADTDSVSAAPTSTGAWSAATITNSSATSAASHTAGYPQTALGTASTVVTGPTAGTTVTGTVNTGGNSNSLADVAMYYYETDLRNPGNCTSGSATGADLCPKNSAGAYSPNVPGNNPDNNPKPHMTTFTLGLGVNGLLNYSSSYSTDNAGDYYQIKTGSKNWPDPDTSATSPYGNTSNSVIERVDDLWHAAVNGRGTYFSAKDPGALVKSLNAALSGMSTRLGYGTSAATSNLAPILGDNSLYVASYTTAQWTGNLVAESINVDTGAVNPTAAWCVESVPADTANGIPACNGQLANQVAAAGDSRTIYFNKNGTLTSFTYSALPSAQQAYFDPSKLSQWSSTFDAAAKTTATGTTLVDFLRGQTQYESQNGSSANLYRDRKATLGDVVDSQPVFLGKPISEFTDLGYNTWKNSTAQKNRGKTVFVGANDGMLHAFNAITGVERWAYVPTPVMPNMYWLADNTYTTNHHNYVNSRAVYSDVCVKNCKNAATADWRTILIGGLGGGGRGYYALDVTDPAVPKLLWEFTSLNDADLGYTFGYPLAVKKSDGTWVVIVSSGYDNVSLANGDPYDADGSGKGFLFVLDPLTGTVLDKIGTNVGSKTTPSGLGKLAFWADVPDQDATAVYAYGGDLLGNLWRFDINTTNTADKVVKLATFTDASSNLQPITTRPELAKVNGTRVVYVATGKYLEASDLDSSQFKTQSLYAIADDGSTVTSPRTALVKQTLTNAKPNRTVTSNPVAISPPTVMGWFLDFPDSGERTNVDMILADGTLLVPTNVPTNGICEAGGYSWLNFLNYRTGSVVPGANSAGTWSGNDLTTGINLVWIQGKPAVIRTGSGTAPGLLPGIPFNPGGAIGVTGHRVSWRELITK